MRLRGKVAIVTGAASGLGEATTTLFTREGARVIAVDRDDERLLKTHGDNAAVQCVAKDITAVDAPKTIVDSALARYGKLDTLVNNAGIEGDRGTVEATTDETWRRVFDVNIDSMFRLCRAAASSLAASGCGRIVNVSSLVGFMAIPGCPAYLASKQAVVGLTRSLAVELASGGVTANCIAPGMIRTPINQNRSEERLQSIRARIPLGRFGKVMDIAKMALFLASDDADYITGQVFYVDGGWSINLA